MEVARNNNKLVSLGIIKHTNTDFVRLGVS